MALRWALILLATALIAASCAALGDDERLEFGDQAVEVLAVWEDVEAGRFRAVLDRFETRTGATVRYTSTGGRGIGDVLDERIAEHDPPDVAVVPLPGILRRYAETGAIHPIEDLVGEDIDRAYAPAWRALGSVDDTLYGVWFKAAHKSLVWYNVGLLEQAGRVPPTDFEDLVALAHDLAASGTAAFAVGGADAWTLTDLFENIYLRVAGPAGYDALARGDRPWTHPTVHEALRLMALLLAPGLLAGGPDGVLATTFPESVGQVFADPPQAALLPGADFVAGFIGETGALLGVHADVFVFPEITGSGRLVVAGGDAAVLFSTTPVAEALLRHLASAEAGEVWASLGGFLSPNGEVSLERYPDERTRTIARSLLEAGDGLRFDLSDLQPVEFGGTSGQGMLQILQDFVAEPSDPHGTARRLDDAARAIRARR